MMGHLYVVCKDHQLFPESNHTTRVLPFWGQDGFDPSIQGMNPVLYIPGEFCRQADVLSAAERLRVPVLLEKGAFLSPREMGLVKAKMPNTEVIIVEAGASFGYADRVCDPRSIGFLQRAGFPVGINLSALISHPDFHYEHHPKWLDDIKFVTDIIRMGAAFDIANWVCDFADYPLILSALKASQLIKD